MSRPFLLAALLCALALALAACGGDSKSSDNSAAAAGPTPTADETVAALAASISKDLKAKPQLAIPAGGTPDKLTVKDIVVGTGKKAKPGDTVQMQYVGSLWSTGSEFEATWDSGQPFSFPLGQSQVIKGWDQGIKGMRIGGRRLLVIPPALGYGAQGSPPKIPADETLAFVVDLTQIK
jgi:peptidylprolyl isomerase